MITSFVAATSTTPAYRISTNPHAKCVYGSDATYKGAVLPMTPGTFIAQGSDRKQVRNPEAENGLWGNEKDALDALARS
jgi:hypothetical protein